MHHANYHRRLSVVLVLMMVAVPVGLGALTTIAISAGMYTFNASSALAENAWVLIWQQPGIVKSLVLSTTTALGSTVLALLIAVCLLYASRQFVGNRLLQGGLPVLLSVPHAAFAIGFAFLISPSGWIVRLVSPWLTGWSRPPDLATVQDSFGLALTLGLALKEAPFLLLVLVAALNQIEHRRTIWVGRSLGYDDWQIWWRLLLPQLYRQIRLPLLVVFAYGVSVVDMARILGPGLPPTFAVQITLWLGDPDINKWRIGSAGALVLALLTLFLCVVALLVERVLARWFGRARVDGRRQRPVLRRVAGIALPLASLAIIVGVLSVTLLWSITWRWPFPSALPGSLRLDYWHRNLDIISSLAANTVVLAMASSGIALLLSVSFLETHQRLPSWWLPVLYAPLLLPQLTFLFGIQSALAFFRFDGKLLSVVWVHVVFVLPYTLLALSGFWQAYEQRYSTLAATLGKSPLQVFITIKLPVMLRPMCFAFAIGFSVSIAQYLSTLFVGAGRVPTLTTEAVSMAAGGDRRLIAILAFVQMVLPLLVFGAAFAWPAWRHRNRAGLRL